MKPPATEPLSMAEPLTILPRPNTVSSSPLKPLPERVDQPSLDGPEKKVNPSPSSSETAAQSQNPASTCQSST